MADTERPQIYLITPPEFELSTFQNDLAAVLDATEIACVRLALGDPTSFSSWIDTPIALRNAGCCRTKPRSDSSR